jgi:hypothetical protein
LPGVWIDFAKSFRRKATGTLQGEMNSAVHADAASNGLVKITRTDNGDETVVAIQGVAATRVASAARAASLCAGHAQQLGGASPPANLMEVKA